MANCAPLPLRVMVVYWVLLPPLTTALLGVALKLEALPATPTVACSEAKVNWPLWTPPPALAAIWPLLTRSVVFAPFCNCTLPVPAWELPTTVVLSWSAAAALMVVLPVITFIEAVKLLVVPTRLLTPWLNDTVERFAPLPLVMVVPVTASTTSWLSGPACTVLVLPVTVLVKPRMTFAPLLKLALEEPLTIWVTPVMLLFVPVRLFVVPEMLLTMPVTVLVPLLTLTLAAPLVIWVTPVTVLFVPVMTLFTPVTVLVPLFTLTLAAPLVTWVVPLMALFVPVMTLFTPVTVLVPLFTLTLAAPLVTWVMPVMLLFVAFKLLVVPVSVLVTPVRVLTPLFTLTLAAPLVTWVAPVIVLLAPEMALTPLSKLTLEALAPLPLVMKVAPDRLLVVPTSWLVVPVKVLTPWFTCTEAAPL